MARLLRLASSLLAILIGFAPTCLATTYTVGGAPGWDISTDLDNWASDKTFYVGDVLFFQYSSSNSVEEVDRGSFDNCTTTNPLQTFSNGNTSIPLTRPGGWYFTSGNRLYCLGGMKLQVEAISNQTSAPAGAPMPDSGGPAGALPDQPASRSGNPSVPTSDGFRSIHLGMDFFSVLLGLVATLCLHVTI